MCASALTQGQVLVVKTANGDTTSTTVLDTEAYVLGDGVPIWWQTSDSAQLSSGPATLPSRTMPKATTTASISAPRITSTSLNQQQHDGLTKDAKVGIGLGIPLAAIAGLALGFYLFGWRRRNRTSTGNPVLQQSSTTVMDHHSLPELRNTGLRV